MSSPIVWDDVGKRKFETGCDRGVLYTSGNPGVPWNGLISISEDVSGGESTPNYFDGIKFRDDVASEDYQATLTAFTYPKEFGPCDGYIESVAPGVYLPLQNRMPFDLAYRVLIGNDVDGADHGYKIHLVWNATAQPSARSHSTITDDASGENFAWTITAVPEPATNFKPTAHMVIDSTETDDFLLGILEAMLYGSNSSNAHLPSQGAIINLLGGLTSIDLVDGGSSTGSGSGTLDGGSPSDAGEGLVDGGLAPGASDGIIEIIDNGDGTWTAEAPDDLVFWTDGGHTAFEIDTARVLFLDDDTYVLPVTEDDL